MKKYMLVLPLLIFLVVIAAIACKSSTANEDKPVAKEAPEELIKHGEYLVSVLGCDDCHSPKKMGPQGPELIPELRLSGYQANNPLTPPDENALKQGWFLMNADLTSAIGPWGRSFAANLTSDETGIGNWKEEQFFKAIREGKYKGLDNARPLMPPMPWFNYKNLTDHDLKAVFAFLKSTKPVKNLVPDYMPPANME